MMQITEVRVFPVQEEKLKAFVSIVIDDCFLVSDIKVIQGKQGLFASMPRKKKKNGEFKDIAHPLNSETRNMIESRIIEEYSKLVSPGSALQPRSASEAERAEAAVNRATKPRELGEKKSEATAPPNPGTVPEEPKRPSFDGDDITLSDSFWTSSKT